MIFISFATCGRPYIFKKICYADVWQYSQYILYIFIKKWDYRQLTIFDSPKYWTIIAGLSPITFCSLARGRQTRQRSYRLSYKTVYYTQVTSISRTRRTPSYIQYAQRFLTWDCFLQEVRQAIAPYNHEKTAYYRHTPPLNVLIATPHKDSFNSSATSRFRALRAQREREKKSPNQPVPSHELYSARAAFSRTYRSRLDQLIQYDRLWASINLRA